MSENASNDVDQNNDSKVDVNELMAKVKGLEAKATRLEEESMKFKSRAQQAEGKLSEAEKARLEEEGKWQELFQKERDERKKLEATVNDRTSKVLREKLRSEVAAHAKDAHDVDMLLRVNEHQKLLELDEENLSVKGVEEFIKAARQTHGYLFTKKGMPPMDHKKPDSGNQDFKTDEEKYHEELRRATSRKEMNEIRKKYGKPIDQFGY